MVKAIRAAVEDTLRWAIRLRRDRRAARSLRQAFGRLSEHELDRSLADVGMNRGDLPVVLASGNARRRLMARMMAHFKADPKAIAPRYWGALREAERVCAHCANDRRCHRWLDWDRPNDAPRVFCPNAALFDSMARDARTGS